MEYEKEIKAWLHFGSTLDHYRAIEEPLSSLPTIVCILHSLHFLSFSSDMWLASWDGKAKSLTKLKYYMYMYM